MMSDVPVPELAARAVILEPRDYLRIRLLTRDTADARAALDRASAAETACLRHLSAKYEFDVTGATRYLLNDDTFEMGIS